MDYSGGESAREVWFVNRGVVLMRPRDPFVKWVQEADPVVENRVDAAFIRQNAGLYLIPEFEGEVEAWNWIMANAGELLAHQFNEWYTDPALWPERRDWTLLNDWFELEYFETAWDLVDAPLSSDAPEIERGPIH